MTTVELFAGIGGFRLAADASCLRTLWANDLSARACGVYRDRFGATPLREGDIACHAGDIPPHDVLTGGFPCQPFSSAGKKRGVRDPRGTLFQAIVEVLRHHRPRFFVLENVKRLLTMEGGAHFATILSSLTQLDYTVEWRLLNAMHVGLPQNRQRVFLVGESGTPPGAPVVRLAPAEDLHPAAGTDPGDARAWAPIARQRRRFPAWGLAAGQRFLGTDPLRFSAALPRTPVRAILQPDVPDEFDFTAATLAWLPRNTPVNRFVQGVEVLSNQGGGARMGYTIYGIDGVAPTLTCTSSRHYERYKVGDRYRRLTPVEYARLQGFPDDHCAACPPRHQYALYGNAVPPPLAAWVFRRLLPDFSREVERPAGRSLEVTG